MNSITHKLCSIQGRLFELSVRRGFESVGFVKAYMNSDVAAKFNSAYDRSQWMGEEYLLEELAQTYRLAEGKTYPPDVMFWMGYTYTYWAAVYGDSCKKIVRTADPRTMAENYAGLHTVSADMAVQNLKEQHWSRGNNGEKLKDDVLKKVIKGVLNERENATEYQQIINDAGVDILFLLKNEACRMEYQNQLAQYRLHIGRRMHVTYIDRILDMIDKADISPEDKAEYAYVVKDMARDALQKGFTREQFVFLDRLESKLKADGAPNA